MSQLATAIASALSALNTLSGQTLSYRNGITGAFTTLTGSFLEHAEPEVITYDDNRHAVMVPEAARLKVPSGSTRLIAGTPNKPGAQVKHTLGSNVTIWAVIGATHTDTQSIYLLARALVQTSGPERESVR